MDQFRPRDDQYSVKDLQRNVDDFKQKLENFIRGRGMWLVLLVVVLIYFMTGFYRVGPGEKGGELLLGKISGVTDPGLHYCLPPPFMNRSVVQVAKVRRAEIGFRSDGTRSRSLQAESLMLTGDENIGEVHFSVQYVVRDPVKFLFGAKDPVAALRASTEIALRGVVGQNSLDYTMTEGREKIQREVADYLQKLLDAYNTGLEVTQANLLPVAFPAPVQESVNEVVRAWEDRERLIKEAEGYKEDILPKARGQARREILEAKAYRDQRIIRAEGDARKFLSVLEPYSKFPLVTRERLYLEAIERYLPGTTKIVMSEPASRVLPLLPFSLIPAPMEVKQPGPDQVQPSSKKKGK